MKISTIESPGENKEKYFVLIRVWKTKYCRKLVAEKNASTTVVVNSEHQQQCNPSVFLIQAYTYSIFGDII